MTESALDGLVRRMMSSETTSLMLLRRVGGTDDAPAFRSLAMAPGDFGGRYLTEGFAGHRDPKASYFAWRQHLFSPASILTGAERGLLPWFYALGKEDVSLLVVDRFSPLEGAYKGTLESGRRMELTPY